MKTLIALFLLAILAIGCTTYAPQPAQTPAQGTQPTAATAQPAKEATALPAIPAATQDATQPTASPAGQQPAAPSAAQPSPATVEIKDFAFNPANVEITAGQQVIWINADQARHTATSDSGAFDTGPIGNGQNAAQVFTEPGIYAYHCTPHPYMKGTITVK